MSRRVEVAVVGGGPIGLAVAWRCAQRGRRVAVFDPATGSGASSVAAGMLSAVSESYFGERALTALLVASAGRWPAFAAELTAATGHDLGYRTEGTLVVAVTADDLAVADRLRAYQAGLGLPIEPLGGTALRDREPLLAPGVRGGAYAPMDHQVDPRRLVAALYRAAVAAGATVRAEAVTDLSTVDADVTVVAAGCGTAALTGLPIRPVKGQILRLAPRAERGPADAGFGHVIRGYVDGFDVYLVPRRSGEVVVGATVEERADGAVTAGAVRDLLRAATALIPDLCEYALVETGVGHRPGTPDNAPVIGALPGRPGVIVAAGHHRHGIVLTPVTADVVADLVETGLAGADPAGVAAAPGVLVPFGPARFEGAVRA